MQLEEEIIIEASPEKVFSVYEDISGWSSWDPDTKSAQLEGRFCSGSCGIIRPRFGPAWKLYFTEVTPPRSFTAEIRLPMFVIRFDHELFPCSAGTRTLYRIVFSGILAPVLGTLVGYMLRNGMPKSLLGLKRAVEQKNPL